MRIGVLADTHIPVATRKLPLNILSLLEGVDLIFHAGDILELSVLDDLAKVAKTEAVKGNMDYPDVVEALPLARVFELGRFKIGLAHGWGAPQGLKERLRKEFGEIDCLVFGHTHAPAIEWVDGTLFFNPGSPTDKRFAPYNSLGFLEIDEEIKPEIVRL